MQYVEDVGMGLLTILGTVGKAVLSSVIPSLGDKLVEKVNEFVGTDNKLDPKTATGEEVAKAVEGLPPETQAILIQSEVAKKVAGYKFEQHIDDNTVKIRLAMLHADKGYGWVRPTVVILMAILVMAGLGCAIYSNWFIAQSVMEAFKSDKMGVSTAAELTALRTLLPDYTSWSIILGFPIWVIRSYFFDRSEDKRARANAQVGVATEPKKTFGGSIGDVITKKVFKL